MFSIACLFKLCKRSHEKNIGGGGRAYRRELSSSFYFRGWCVMFYSIAKAARVLGLDRQTVIKAIEKGQIGAIELGSRKLIPKKEIERLTLTHEKA